MTQYENYRAHQPIVTVRYPQLAPALRFLEKQQDEHFDLVRRLCGMTAGQDSTPLFQVDIVLLSVLNRSLDLIDGFLATYDRWNLNTAAPQVRMQVDNLLRVTMLRVAPPNTVTTLLLSGERLSSHVDPLAPSGKKFKLTDARLREHARPNFSWLDRVYEEASSWVHFSTTHVGMTMHVEGDGITISGRFPSDIDCYSYDFLEQVLWAMNETTSGIIETVGQFAASKEHASGGWSTAADGSPINHGRHTEI